MMAFVVKISQQLFHGYEFLNWLFSTWVVREAKTLYPVCDPYLDQYASIVELLRVYFSKREKVFGDSGEALTWQNRFVLEVLGASEG